MEINNHGGTPPPTPSKPRHANLLKKGKKRSQYSKHKRSGTKRQSTFDYCAARNAIGDLTANAQIIGASIDPAPTRIRKGQSPLKSILKLKLKDAEINNKKLKSTVKRLNFSNKRLTGQCKRLCDRMTSLSVEKRDLMKRLNQQEKASDKLSKALLAEVETRIECASAMVLQTDVFSAQHLESANLHATEIGEFATEIGELKVDLRKVRNEKYHTEEQLKKTKAIGASRLKRLNESKEQNSKLCDELRVVKKQKLDHDLEHERILIALELQLNKSKESDRRLIVASTKQLQKERVMWQALHFEAENLLSKKSDEVHDVKQRSRLLIKLQYDKAMDRETKLLEKIEELKMINIDLQVDNSIAKKKRRHAERKLNKAKATGSSRLKHLKESKDQNSELRDELDNIGSLVSDQKVMIEQYRSIMEQMNASRRSMKQCWCKGRRGAQGRWDVWVVIFCCELLVIGVQPSAVPQTMVAMYSTLYGETPEQVPSVNFVRQCRSIIEEVGLMITAIKMGIADSWPYWGDDATTRRHLTWSALVIGLMGSDHKLDPVIVSSCIFLEDESAQGTNDALFSKIDSLKGNLERLRDEVQRSCPDLLIQIPRPSSINRNKLKDAVFMGDTCATQQKSKRLKILEVGGNEKNQLDCHHHMRNLYLGKETERAMASHLTALLRDSLDEIDPSLRVATPHVAIARAFDKLLKLSCNYVKGDGDLFATFVRKHHPGVLLYPVESTHGSRQDIVFSSSVAMVMNRDVVNRFLDYMLSMPDNDGDSILRRNIFCVLSSSEMIAQCRVLAILHFTAMLPLRWLAGKMHEMSTYEWGARHMGHVLDVFYQKLLLIQQSPSLFVSKMFMTSLFLSIEEKLPPFVEYLDATFMRKGSSDVTVVSRRSGARIMSMKRARDEMFDPKCKTNIDTDIRVRELGKIVIDAILVYMADPKNATHRNLSISGSPMSFEHCGDDKLLGIHATNDQCESALGGATAGIQRGNMIGAHNASAVSTAKKNSVFRRTIPNKRNHTKKNGRDEGKLTKPTMGFFHQFPKRIQQAMVVVAIKHAPVIRESNRADVERQRKWKLDKEELRREKGMKKATDNQLENTLLFCKYNTNAAVKGKPSEVTRWLKGIRGDKRKREALKENISIRVKGFGWDQFRIPWTRNRQDRPIKELAKHLRDILTFELSATIPTEPAGTMKMRKFVPVLGTLTDERRMLDANHFKSGQDMKDAAMKLACERKARDDHTSIYATYQQWDVPKPRELVGRRIDIFWPIKDAGASRFSGGSWFQGKVTAVVNGYTVKVLWDPMPDVTGYEEGSKESEDITLAPDLWRRHIRYGWRYDLDVELVNNYYDKDDIIDDENAYEVENMAVEESDDESDCDESTEAS